MRPLPDDQPSLAIAFLCAPAATPVLAIPLAAFLPGVYASTLDGLMLLPFVVVVSLIFGYLGMLCVGLPVFFALRLTRRLEAARMCIFTSLFAGGAWALMVDRSWPIFIVGAACSLGVSAFFCVLRGIQFGLDPAKR